VSISGVETETEKGSIDVFVIRFFKDMCSLLDRLSDHSNRISSTTIKSNILTMVVIAAAMDYW